MHLCALYAAYLTKRGPGVSDYTDNFKAEYDELAEQVKTRVLPLVDAGIADNWASDISGRARAFGSMVKGGMDIPKAAALSGLLLEE